MGKSHPKSPCCQALIRRYGLRRRQCCRCKSTWRIRAKKRGRKLKRETVSFLHRYLDHQMVPLFAQVKSSGKATDSLERRLKRSKNKFLKQTSWPLLPEEGELIIVADAMVKCISRRWYTVYLMLIRSSGENKAIIAPPLILPGTENIRDWYTAFRSLPIKVHEHIRALVCDGHRGFYSYALRNGWLLQRCHFHVIAAIQGRRSRWHRSMHKAEGERLYQLVNKVLTTDQKDCLFQSLQDLETICQNTTSPQLRKILSGFVNYHQDFRTYLYHPDLHLPKTSNTAESLVGCIRELCRRARGFRTLASFTSWIEAEIKHRQTIACNGFNQPN